MPTDPEKAKEEYEKFFQAISKYAKTLASKYEDGQLPYYCKIEFGNSLEENYLTIGLGECPDELTTPEQLEVVDAVKKMTKKRTQKPQEGNGKVHTPT